MVLNEEVLARRRETLGPDHADTVRSLDNLAVIYVKAGMTDKAQAVLQEEFNVLTAKQPNGWTRFDVESWLGGTYLEQKHYATAEPLLLGGYQGMKERLDKIPASQRYLLAAAADRLARLYSAWNKADEATRWQRTHEQLKADCGVAEAAA